MHSFPGARLVLLFILFSFRFDNPLFSDELQDPDFTPSLVNITAMPSSMVAGVSVISGDYVEHDQDHVVSGPDSYIVGHTYVSSSLEEGTLGDGWNFLHDHLLQVHQPATILYARGDITGSRDMDGVHDHRDHQKNRETLDWAPEPALPNKKYIFAQLQEPFGSTLTFEGRFEGSKKHPVLKDFKVKTKNSGFTNVSGGAISGQTNIKNIRLRWDKKSDSWQVLLGDGTKRIYKRQWQLKEKDKNKKDRVYAQFNRDYHLVEERKPSGNVITYSYNSDHELEWMRLFGRGGQELSHVHFEQKSKHAFAKNHSLQVTNSDNLDCCYDFVHLRGRDKDGKQLKNSFGVSGIHRPGRPSVRFVYDEKSDNHIRRLERKEALDGSFIEVKYYRPHSNDMGNGEVRTLNRTDLRRFNKNKVRYLKAPCGPDGQTVRTHAFRYYKSGKKAGYADVLDAENQRTRYRWNEERRLIKIERFNADNQLAMAEKFVWGKGKLDGHLIATIILDADNKANLARAFSYDSRGNILTETLYGRFTENKGQIRHKDGDFSGTTCDALLTSYTYSTDGFNLKTSECDPVGNYTYYEYVKGTNLLKAKLICDGKTISKREFYRYDKNGSLIETIVDDGDSRDKKDIKQVTERYITRVTPRMQSPHFGEPEVIEEYYYSVAKNREVLLKKRVNHFSKKGFVKKQELYDSNGKLAAATHFDHDEVGRIIYKQDPCGRVERYEYDSCGRPIKKAGPKVTNYYFYDVMGRLIREEEHLADHAPLITHFGYDNLGRKIREVNAQGNEIQYQYDVLNRITKITHPPLFDENRSKIVPTKSFQYQKLGTIKIETDAAGYKTTTTYNARGAPFEQELSDGTMRFCSYDKKGNCVKEVAYNGVEIQYAYDAFNRMTSCKMVQGSNILSLHAYTYKGFHLASETSPTGETLSFRYDKAGRQKLRYLQDDLQASYHYDTLGRLEYERTYFDKGRYSCKKYDYDAENRITSEILLDDSDKTHTYTLFEYDLEGNCKEKSIPTNSFLTSEKWEFLAHSLPSKSTDALGNVRHYDYDFHFLNSHGQRVCRKRSVDPRGVYEDVIFDTHGNISLVCAFSPLGDLVSKKELFYDSRGNCRVIFEHAIVDGTSTKVVKTICTYGPNNRLEKIVEAAGTDEEKTTHYLYNRWGQKKRAISSDNTTLHYQYDAKGRVKQFYSDDNSVNYSYEYDPSDRILSVTNEVSRAKTERCYSDRGELVSETLETGVSLKYSYDLSGRLHKLTLPDRSSVLYDYTPNHIAKVTRRNAQKALLWQHVITERDLSGKPLKAELAGSAGTLEAKHDALLRTTHISHPKYAQEAASFDALGNILTLKTTDSVGAVESHFAYDFLSQLTSESGHVTHSYAYNSLFDRHEVDDARYEVNSLHAVLSDGSKEYRYDKKGNRIAKGKRHYCYDALDRLVKVMFRDGSSVSYSYDAFDRRLEKIHYACDGSQKVRFRYIYAIQNELGVIDSDGKITELRVLGEGIGAEIGASVALELQGKLFVPLHDMRGSVAALLDETGSLVESYRYDAFGNEQIYDAENRLSKKSLVNNPWRFSSKRTDDETGHVYFGRRYYDPKLGSWLTMDPLGLKAGPNLYAYVLNNPMNRFDLYGLEEESLADRSLLERVGDAAVDTLRRVRDLACKIGEEVVHHMPHLGSINDTIEDHLRSFRGAAPLDRSRGLQQVHWGSRTSTGCDAAVHVHGIMNSSKDAVKNALYMKEIMGEGSPDIYVLKDPSDGICMDLLRAFMNIIGIKTSDIESFTDALRFLADKYPPGGYVFVNPHSNGGQRVFLSSRDLSDKQMRKFFVHGIGATHQFSDRDGFSKTKNDCARSDLVPWISDPIGVIRGFVTGEDKTNFVGSILKIPLTSHPYTSKEYSEVLKKSLKTHVG